MSWFQTMATPCTTHCSSSAHCLVCWYIGRLHQPECWKYYLSEPSLDVENHYCLWLRHIFLHSEDFEKLNKGTILAWIILILILVKLYAVFAQQIIEVNYKWKSRFTGVGVQLNQDKSYSLHQLLLQRSLQQLHKRKRRKLSVTFFRHCRPSFSSKWQAELLKSCLRSQNPSLSRINTRKTTL